MRFEFVCEQCSRHSRLCGPLLSVSHVQILEGGLGRWVVWHLSWPPPAALEPLMDLLSGGSCANTGRGQRWGRLHSAASNGAIVPSLPGAVSTGLGLPQSIHRLYKGHRSGNGCRVVIWTQWVIKSLFLFFYSSNVILGLLCGNYPWFLSAVFKNLVKVTLIWNTSGMKQDLAVRQMLYHENSPFQSFNDWLVKIDFFIMLNYFFLFDPGEQIKK